MRWLLFVFTVLIALSTPVSASAAEPSCVNPKVAADSLFQFQRSGSHNPSKAKACFDVPPGQSGERLAVHLKQVLDARGHWVPISSMSTDPMYKDEAGRHQVQPMPDEFPLLVLEKKGERWLYSKSTLEQVDALYRETFSPISQWFQSQLPAFFYTRVLGLYLWQYSYAFLLFLVALAAGQVAHILLRTQVRALIQRAGLRMTEEIYARVNGPITLLATFGVLLWGVSDLQLGIQLSALAYTVLWVLIGLSGALLLVRFVGVAGDVAGNWADATESKLDDQLVPLLEQAARILIMVLTVLFILDAMGVDVWKLAAGVGIGGLAFALAAQDTVANLFGSVQIFVDKPFQIGDWVKIGSVEGVVEEVGFRSTRVRTFHNSLVTIPNSQITNTNVDNLGLRTRRRCKMMLGLTYDTPPDKLQAFVEGVRAILAAHPAVERTYEVHVYNLGDSAIEILVYYHFQVPGWHEELRAKSQNILEFVRLAHELGVSFAFPSSSVYVESTPERPLPGHDPYELVDLERIATAFGPEGDLSMPRGPGIRTRWSVQARAAREKMGSAAGE